VSIIMMNNSQAEFGNRLAYGMLLPYIYRLQGHKVGIVCAHDFPDHWKKLWFDVMDIRWSGIKDGELGRHQIVETVFDRYMIHGSILNIKPLPIPEPESCRPIDEKYVVIIPSVFEPNLPREEWTGMCSAQYLNYDNWRRIAHHLRDSGLRIVGYASEQQCTEEFLDEICDEYRFYSVRECKHTHDDLAKQLVYMKFAEISVAVGGAFLIGLTFDVPMLGWDVGGSNSRHLSSITEIMMRTRRRFHRLPVGDVITGMFGTGNHYENETTREYHQNIYEYLILSYLSHEFGFEYHPQNEIMCSPFEDIPPNKQWMSDWRIRDASFLVKDLRFVPFWKERNEDENEFSELINFMSKSQPKRIVKIGMKNGSTAFVFSAFASITGAKFVGVEEDEECRRIALGKMKQVSYDELSVVGGTDEIDGCCDFIYIDAETRNDLMEDVTKIESILADGGVLAINGTNNESVKKALERLSSFYVLSKHFVRPANNPLSLFSGEKGISVYERVAKDSV